MMDSIKIKKNMPMMVISNRFGTVRQQTAKSSLKKPLNTKVSCSYSNYMRKETLLKTKQSHDARQSTEVALPQKKTSLQPKVKLHTRPRFKQ